ncbi:MAG: alginate export family protein [Vicinamibacterales bacterium]
MLAAGLVAGPVSAQTAGTPAPSSAAPPAPVLPPWLQVHAEHRTRYESVDFRYRANEVGADQAFNFRTRLQVRLTSPHAFAYSEVQDSRIALDDSASTVGISQVLNTHVLQLHGGLVWKDVGARKLTWQVEAGRFSRDFGFRRVISRSIYRNTTNAFDGVIGKVAGGTWSVQALGFRPVLYVYPSLDRDPRFTRLRVGGVYASSTRLPAANADVYGLVWRDGRAAPAATRRSLTTVGARVFGKGGPAGRAEYEVESALQVGHVGPLDHRAWFGHAQAGYTWTAPWRPRLLAIADYASGDADPGDGRSGAYDLLIGARRFEFGPMGINGLIPRSNIVSPGLWLITRPTAPLETGVQLRGVWLAEVRDRWRSTGLVDPTGAAGRHVGEQVEWRTRYRVTPHLDFDGGLTVFREGRFVRTLKPSPHGYAVHVYAGLEVRY